MRKECWCADRKAVTQRLKILLLQRGLCQTVERNVAIVGVLLYGQFASFTQLLALAQLELKVVEAWCLVTQLKLDEPMILFSALS